MAVLYPPTAKTVALFRFTACRQSESSFGVLSWWTVMWERRNTKLKCAPISFSRKFRWNMCLGPLRCFIEVLPKDFDWGTERVCFAESCVFVYRYLCDHLYALVRIYVVAATEVRVTNLLLYCKASERYFYSKSLFNILKPSGNFTYHQV
jgi:hypothetical protein